MPMTPTDARTCLAIRKWPAPRAQERQHERVHLRRAVFQMTQRRERVEQIQRQKRKAKQRRTAVEGSSDGAPKRLHGS